MVREFKIGRNDPCPCGSGKKYKRCCGAKSQAYIGRDRETDYFRFNREVAYKGKVGRKREDFCIHYIEWKQSVFRKIEEAQIEQASASGKTISCYKGCSFCCVQHVSAFLQECEAIVYYLYHNERVLTAFLTAYPRWRAEIRKNGDMFKAMDRLLTIAHASGYTEENRQAVMEQAERYFSQNIACPFLSGGVCLIYGVRPFPCAGHISTSPPSWCNPLIDREPKIYEAVPTAVEVDLQFYYGSPNPIFGTMPILVYETLKGGYVYLSVFPGLGGLQYEAMNDPEIKVIAKSF